MEIIIFVAVFGFALWWFFLRTPSETSGASAPYKVETPNVQDTAPVVEPDPVAEIAPVEILPVSSSDLPIIANTPAKKPRKPRAPKTEEVATKTPAAKKADPVKKAAAIKAAPKKPRSKKS